MASTTRPNETATPKDPVGLHVDRKIDRIVLTGFMGAGKSTVGKILATQLDWQFIDADDEIEAAAGMTVAAVFANQGESHFRQLEHETIRHLAASQRIVLALGGGAIEHERTRSLLLASATTRLIHLDATLATVLERCRGTESIRPVLQDHPRLEARYNLRIPLYRESHHSIAVDELTPEATVQAIRAVLNI